MMHCRKAHAFDNAKLKPQFTNRAAADGLTFKPGLPKWALGNHPASMLDDSRFWPIVCRNTNMGEIDCGQILLYQLRIKWEIIRKHENLLPCQVDYRPVC